MEERVSQTLAWSLGCWSLCSTLFKGPLNTSDHNCTTCKTKDQYLPHLLHELQWTICWTTKVFRSESHMAHPLRAHLSKGSIVKKKCRNKHFFQSSDGQNWDGNIKVFQGLSIGSVRRFVQTWFNGTLKLSGVLFSALYCWITPVPNTPRSLKRERQHQAVSR